MKPTNAEIEGQMSTDDHGQRREDFQPEMPYDFLPTSVFDVPTNAERMMRTVGAVEAQREEEGETSFCESKPERGETPTDATAGHPTTRPSHREDVVAPLTVSPMSSFGDYRPDLEVDGERWPNRKPEQIEREQTSALRRCIADLESQVAALTKMANQYQALCNQYSAIIDRLGKGGAA